MNDFLLRRFTRCTASWYEYDMAKSYVAIVSRPGLLALMSEDVAVSTVAGRYLEPGAPVKAAALGAVLDDNAAGSVVRCLRQGEPLAALETLAGRAEHLGTWLPYSDSVALKA
jgi:hypothetical protein